MSFSVRRAVPIAFGTLALYAFGVAAPEGAPAAVNYDIVYVRAPRAGDSTIVPLPEVKDPIQISPGTDLMLLHPDGREEVLVPGGDGAVVDPVVSFDAAWVYFAKFHDQRPEALNVQRRHASRAGSDLFKINLKTREVIRLTFQEWTPNTGAAEWSDAPQRASGPGTYSLGYGIFNLGPCPLPGGRLMFTSSRNGFRANKDYTFPNLQLFVMDDDGRNVEQVGHLNLGSALHPSVLMDGRVMFSSYEAEGLRDPRQWGLWAIEPDGRNWSPLLSAFRPFTAFHSHAQRSNGDVTVVDYYNQNNNGFGTLLGFPAAAPAGRPLFGSPNPDDPSNPPLAWGSSVSREGVERVRRVSYPFSPAGLYTLTPFAHGDDVASSRGADGKWAGKVMQPAAAPANSMLLVWSGGPANSMERPVRFPAYDAGIYLLTGRVADRPESLLRIRDTHEYNELQPHAVAPYKAIYGIDQPRALPWLPNDGSLSADLPAGTPFGLVGASTFYKRDTSPGVGVARFGGADPFNTPANYTSTNWETQGADAGHYSNDDIFAVRILAMEPSSHRSYGPAEGDGFFSHANERLRILGEILLRKTDAAGRVVRDADGNPDTSFLAKIPADTPFTFQTLDRNGTVLNMSQTWHQVRPGEVRTDCGGCHAHAQVPTAFAGTAASRPGYHIADLTQSTPLLTRTGAGEPTVAVRPYGALDVEYYRDIKPLLQRSCVQCHAAAGRHEAGLVLDDTTLVDGYENTYNRLARDERARFGIPPIIPSHEWRNNNASRYVRKFQSRRSLLAWKVFGRRLDGWTNADFPTESVPGDAATLPKGANAGDADLDYSGVMCPPPGSGVPPLSAEEQLRIARWIDLGAPVTSPLPAFAGRGWFQDDLRPTLTLSEPARGVHSAPLSLIRIGAFDYYSGLDLSAWSVRASFPVNGRLAGAELADLLRASGQGIWTIALDPPVTNLADGTVTVTVRDRQRNLSKVERSFSVRAAR